MATFPRVISACILLAGLAVAAGCNSSTPPTTLNVATWKWIEQTNPQTGNSNLIRVPVPNISVWGNYSNPNGAASGTLTSYNGWTSATNPDNLAIPAVYQAQNLYVTRILESLGSGTDYLQFDDGG